MDPELDRRLAELERKVDATYKTAESARKMFLWTIIISIILVVLPLIGLAFVWPSLISSFNINSVIQ